MRPDDDEIEVPIPLDRETRALLVPFARACGVHPVRAAADLLREVLKDDAAAHGQNHPGNGTLN